MTPTSTGPQRRPGVSTLSSRKELTAEARELKGELYCLPCHDKMGVPICGACRRPIEGRVVNALGKQWHVEVSGVGPDGRWRPHEALRSPTPRTWAGSQQAPSSWVLPLLPLAGDQLVHRSQETRAHSPWLGSHAHLPSSPCWPSRGFQSDKKPLGTTCPGSWVGLQLTEPGVRTAHTDVEAGHTCGGAP